MTWLDERLFGWSRSARRGTSVWGEAPSSQDVSGAATPEVSDSEEEGDYDNVISYLGAYTGSNGGGRARAKSQRGSYADLQALKNSNSPNASRAALSPIYQNREGNAFTVEPSSSNSSPTTEVSIEGSDVRAKRRNSRDRRMSLTDIVPVEKIGELSPADTFKESTNKLNEESEAAHNPDA